MYIDQYNTLAGSFTGPVNPATSPSPRLTYDSAEQRPGATYPNKMPVVGLEAWFTQIPPVTRTWLALSVLTSVAVVRPRQNPKFKIITNQTIPIPVPCNCSNVNW